MVNDRLHHLRKKILGSFLLLALLAVLSWVGVGQAEPEPGGPTVQAGSAGKPMPAAGAGSSVTPSSSASKAVPAKKVAGKPTPTKGAPGGQPDSTPKRGAEISGRRDPFKLPPPPSPASEAGGVEVTGPLPPGTRGLIIGQLKLGGIVRQDTSNTMIAVVTNYTKRAYFLRERDAVYNGVVSKITPDSVVFKENFLDSEGRAGSREVVRRLSAGPGEGR